MTTTHATLKGDHTMFCLLARFRSFLNRHPLTSDERYAHQASWDEPSFLDRLDRRH